MVYGKLMVDFISKKVGFIVFIVVYLGEDEMFVLV